ncbi:MAG: hydroxyacylglutathione hydrolase, partial [Candidatus Eremiobacterota bacterium]
MSRVNVHRIPVLSDNYSYLVEDTTERTCVIVDPAEGPPVIAEVERLGLRPVMVWNTHHHPDHVAGNRAVLDRFGSLPVYGSAGDRGRIPELTVFLNDGDTVEFAGERAAVLFLPGHTSAHIAFHLPDSGHIFLGDVLFGYSCGKVLEGSFEDMFRSVSRVGRLPDSTQVWCGHEYTLNNL